MPGAAAATSWARGAGGVVGGDKPDCDGGCENGEDEQANLLSHAPYEVLHGVTMPDAICTHGRSMRVVDRLNACVHLSFTIGRLEMGQQRLPDLVLALSFVSRVRWRRTRAQFAEAA